MSGEIRPIFSAEALKQLEEVNSKMADVMDVIDNINKTGIKFDSSGGVKNVKSMASATKELNAIEQEELKVKRALEQAQAKLVVAQSETGKELVKTRSEIAATNRETKASESAYASWSLEVKKAKEEAKDAAAELRNLKESGEASSEEIQAAEERFAALSQKAGEMDAEIKKVDESVGDHQRSVGDYGKALEGAASNVTIFGVNLGQLYGQVKSNITAGVSFIKGMKGMQLSSMSAAQGMKVLRIAIASTGIGLLVVAIAAVVVAFQKFQPLADKLSVVMAQIGQVVNILVDRFALLGKGIFNILSGRPEQGFKDLKNATEGLNEELAEEVRLAGLLKEQLIELERSQSILSVAVKQAEARIKELRNVYNDSTKSVEEKNMALEEAIALQKDITKAQEDEQKQLIANAFGYTEYNDKVRNVVEQIQSLDNLYSSSEERARLFNKTLANLGLDLSTEDETKAFVEEIQKLSEISKEGESALMRLGSAQLSLANQLKTQAEAATKAELERIESIEALNRTQVEALKFELNEKLKVLMLEGEITKLKGQELAARLKLEEEYQQKIEEAQEKEAEATLNQLSALKAKAELYGENIAQLEQLANSSSVTAEKQIQINEEVEFYKSRLEEVTQELEKIGFQYGEIVDAQKELSDELQKVVDESQATEDSLVKMFENGEISGQQFIDGLANVAEKLQTDLLKATIDKANELLENEKISADERLKIEQELAKAKESLRKAELEDFKEKAQQKIDADKAEKDELLKLQDDFEKAKQQAIDLAFSATRDIASAITENKRVELADELSEFQEAERQKQELNAQLLEQGQITQEQFDARKLKSQIDLQRKEQEIKQKQFKQNQRAAIIQATINTAEAVTKALTSAAFPANLALAAIAATAGAVQIGIIKSQKIPKFRKGVKNFGGGLATIGDGPIGQNREMVKLPSGEKFIAEKEMTMFLPKGTDVYPNTQTEKMLKEDASVPYLRRIDKKIGRRQNVNVTIVNNVLSNSNINYIKARA